MKSRPKKKKKNARGISLSLVVGDEIPEGQLATSKTILYGDAGVDSSKYPEVEQLISAVQFAAGDGRAGSIKLRGSTWETDLQF